MSAELGLGEVVVAKEKALLIRLDELGEEKWIPRSVLEDDSEITEEAEEGDEGEVIVKTWFAEKEGLV